MGKLIITEQEGPIVTLRLNNPPLNILTHDLRWQLYQILSSLRWDKSVRVVIIRGSGEKVFSVGSDLKAFPLDETGLGGREKVAFEQRLYAVLQELPQISIAALSGHVLGGGGELALACDLRIAADNLNIGFPEINVGLFPGASGTQRLLRLVGPAKARELMLIGESIDGKEALRIGLINRLVPLQDLWNETHCLAQKLADKPWLAAQSIKTCINLGLDLDFAGALQVEVEEMTKIFRTHDMAEGISAFNEKRKPHFRHQ